MVYGLDNNQFSDAAFNLALEEYCFRTIHPKADIFLLYVNAPSVVIGRHQNPVEELDLKYARRKDIQVVRRISGGGTVYHDHGNINFSFMTSFRQDSLANIPRYLGPVVNALTRLGVAVHIDTRNDIFIGSQKISGTSQFSDTRRLLVHGTLLFNTDLGVLDRVLASSRKSVRSRSRKSVCSPVGNLSDVLEKQMTLPAFKEHLWASIAELKGGIDKIRFAASDWQGITRLTQTKYRSWWWTYAKSPDFQITMPLAQSGSGIEMVLHIRRWRIRKLDMGRCDINASMRRRIRQNLVGFRFDPGFVKKTITAITAAHRNDTRRKVLAAT